MSNVKINFLSAGAWLFLVGISMLVIRDNAYPWPLKRASDILFLLSLVFSTLYILRQKKIYFFEKPLTKKVGAALAVLFFSLAIASLSGFLTEGTTLNAGGALQILRFLEVAALLLLVGLFQHHDSGFYKKAAIAQLATAAYLWVFIIPNSLHLDMYRFQLWENWPSNVGYYLVVSLSFVFTLLLFHKKRVLATVFLLLIGTGFSALLLWAQSRAAWLGASAAFLFVIWRWADGKNFREIAAGFLLAAALPIFGFFLLHQNIKNNVLGRFFPELSQRVNIVTSSLPETIKTIYSGRLAPRLEDPRRLKLWTIYSKRLIRAPLGLGLSPEPANIGFGQQLPHNTILEILVSAGPIGLAVFIWLFYRGLKNASRIAKAAANEKFWPIYIFAALLGLSISSMFDNMSTFRLLWIVLAMAIFYEPPKSAGQFFETVP